MSTPAYLTLEEFVERYHGQLSEGTLRYWRSMRRARGALGPTWSAIRVEYDPTWRNDAGVAFAAVLHKGVIEPEEAYLERRFGQRNLDYKARVRRWI